MRNIAIAAVGAIFAVTAANAQPASESHTGPVCLTPYLIDHTHTVDPKTILFYMRNGKIWRNSLQGACPELMFHGFVYVARADEVCSNMQSIRVLETGEVCMLGPFTPYAPPPKPLAP